MGVDNVGELLMRRKRYILRRLILSMIIYNAKIESEAKMKTLLPDLVRNTLVLIACPVVLHALALLFLGVTPPGLRPSRLSNVPWQESGDADSARRRRLLSVVKEGVLPCSTASVTAEAA